ncbi:hypothetical protein BDV19DRAFT_372959 [Aspergillus venezuelensis]
MLDVSFTGNFPPCSPPREYQHLKEFKFQAGKQATRRTPVPRAVEAPYKQDLDTPLLSTLRPSLISPLPSTRMLLRSISKMGLSSRTYFWIAKTVSLHPPANGLLILLCSLPSTLLATYYNQARTQHQKKAGRDYPLWLSLLLLASIAVDLPIISTLHPVTILYPRDALNLPPSPEQFALQILGFFLINDLCRYLIQSLVLPVATKPHRAVGEQTSDNDIVAAAIMDFSTPRITMMLGCAVLGIPCWLTEYLGMLHPLSMAGWVILDQNLSALTRIRRR